MYGNVDNISIKLSYGDGEKLGILTFSDRIKIINLLHIIYIYTQYVYIYIKNSFLQFDNKLRL